MGKDCSKNLDGLTRRMKRVHGVLDVAEADDGFYLTTTDLKTVIRDDVFGRTDLQRTQSKIGGKPVYKIVRRRMSTISPLEEKLDVKLQKGLTRCLIYYSKIKLNKK